MAVSDGWHDWPSLPDLFPNIVSGRQERPGLIRCRHRPKSAQGSYARDYFNADLKDDEIEHLYPTAMRNPREYDASEVREALLRRGGPIEVGFVRYAYRPFDNRWIYWEDRGKLVDRPRPDYKPHVFEGNLWLS